MIIDKSQKSPIITIKGKSFMLNINEYESFIEQCELFMSADYDGFETMTQILSDQLLDNADPDTTIEELRPQLKFIREVSFLLKNLVTPVEKENNH